MFKLNRYTPGEVKGNGILFISRCTALFDISFAVVWKRKRTTDNQPAAGFSWNICINTDNEWIDEDEISL